MYDFSLRTCSLRLLQARDQLPPSLPSATPDLETGAQCYVPFVFLWKWKSKTVLSYVTQAFIAAAVFPIPCPAIPPPGYFPFELSSRICKAQLKSGDHIFWGWKADHLSSLFSFTTVWDLMPHCQLPTHLSLPPNCPLFAPNMPTSQRPLLKLWTESEARAKQLGGIKGGPGLPKSSCKVKQAPRECTLESFPIASILFC